MSTVARSNGQKRESGLFDTPVCGQCHTRIQEEDDQSNPPVGLILLRYESTPKGRQAVRAIQPVHDMCKRVLGVKYLGRKNEVFPSHDPVS